MNSSIVMATSNGKSHAQQIVDLNKNEIKLDLNGLRQILDQDGIRDKKVCVVSITGVFRQGKSFLLNFLIRYLRHRYKLKKTNVSNWLNSADGPISGFPWRGGSERHTIGILMWSEIFLAELPSGEEIAIILLDTQGSFDNATSLTHCAAVFALSTLISSVQIYNLKEDIKQYDLAHLECFSGYGQLVGNSDKSPFQNLVFLIRDWPWPHEMEYGANGGKQLLAKRFDSDDQQPQELISQKRNIKELFKEISCFLLPYPGVKVATSRFTFQGDLQDIDPVFNRYIEEFAPSILAPENLVPKTVNGEHIKVGHLLYFIQSYCNCFQTGDVPTLQSMFKASSDAHHIAILNESTAIYEKSMEFIKNKDVNSFDKKSFDKIHYQNKTKAMQHFQQKKIMGNNEIKREYELRLEEKIKEKFAEYQNLNEIKYQKEQELKRETQLRLEEQLRAEQLRQQQQRMHEQKLREEQELRRQEKLKVEKLKREREEQLERQRKHEENLRRERELWRQQQLAEERRRQEEQLRYEEKLKREQELREEQERQHREQLRREQELRREREREYSCQGPSLLEYMQIIQMQAQMRNMCLQELTSSEPAPRRRGRPPGSKNKPK